MTRARVTVTALRARTRSPWKRRSPSTVVSSTTRKTARFRSQYSMKPSTTATAVAQPALLRPVAVHQSGQDPDPFDQLLGQDGDGRLHVLEVLVEGGRRGPGPAGDVDDLDRPPGCGHQQLGGALQQPLAGGPAPMPGDPAVGGGDQLRIVDVPVVDGLVELVSCGVGVGVGVGIGVERWHGRDRCQRRSRRPAAASVSSAPGSSARCMADHGTEGAGPDMTGRQMWSGGCSRPGSAPGGVPARRSGPAVFGGETPGE